MVPGQLSARCARPLDACARRAPAKDRTACRAFSLSHPCANRDTFGTPFRALLANTLDLQNVLTRARPETSRCEAGGKQEHLYAPINRGCEFLHTRFRQASDPRRQVSFKRMKRRCRRKIGTKCLRAEMAIVPYANAVAGSCRSKSGTQAAQARNQALQARRVIPKMSARPASARKLLNFVAHKRFFKCCRPARHARRALSSMEEVLPVCCEYDR